MCWRFFYSMAGAVKSFAVTSVPAAPHAANDDVLSARPRCSYTKEALINSELPAGQGWPVANRARKCLIRREACPDLCRTCRLWEIQDEFFRDSLSKLCVIQRSPDQVVSLVNLHYSRGRLALPRKGLNRMEKIHVL